MIFSLSSGAVAVFPMAPARAPAANMTDASGRRETIASGLFVASQMSDGSFASVLLCAIVSGVSQASLRQANHNTKSKGELRILVSHVCCCATLAVFLLSGAQTQLKGIQIPRRVAHTCGPQCDLQSGSKATHDRRLPRANTHVRLHVYRLSYIKMSETGRSAVV